MQYKNIHFLSTNTDKLHMISHTRHPRVIPLKRHEVVVCFLLGNSPASEFYMPTFQNTVCSIFIGR